MKILFLISRFLDGGIDTVLVEYLNNLCQLTEHDIHLAIGLKMNQSEVFLSRLSPKVKISYLVDQNWLTSYKRSKHHHQKRVFAGIVDELLLNPIRRMQMKNRLRKLAADKDVIIDFDSCHASLISSAPDRAKKIAMFHFSLMSEQKRSPRRVRRLQKGFRKYDHIITISEAMRREMESLWQEHRHKVACIYNSLNLENIEQKAGLKVENPLIEQRYILAIERLEESQKDLTTLIKAYALLTKKNCSELPLLYIIGEGKSRSELEALISQLHLEQQVKLLGFISNPYPWIKAAAAIVHSSKFEGLPTVQIEALLLGKLIVSTDCPTGPSEILNDGKAGLLTPVGDAEALANAMERILTDKELQSQLLKEARLHSFLFSPERNIQLLEQLFCTNEKSN